MGLKTDCSDGLATCGVAEKITATPTGENLMGYVAKRTVARAVNEVLKMGKECPKHVELQKLTKTKQSDIKLVTYRY
jgi:hypothetical protein